MPLAGDEFAFRMLINQIYQHFFLTGLLAFAENSVTVGANLRRRIDLQRGDFDTK